MEAFLEFLSTVLKDNYVIAPIIAFISGIVVAFLPCSVTSLPLLVLYLGGNDKKKAFKYSFVYALGSTLTFVVLGVIVGFFGHKINLLNNFVYIIFGVILILMALILMGIIKFPKINFLDKLKKKNNFIYGIALGILSGIFASPCATPVLIAILSVATLSQNMLLSILLLLAYGIGNSVVLVLLGSFITFTDKLINSQKYNVIGKVLNIITIIFILILGFYMFYLAF